jgi:murein DD-endopeptidase MepM/ murein hydrolase activator NlpD
MEPELYNPFPFTSISQHFGANANESYAHGGLKGHTAIDWNVPFGTPLSACTDAPVYSVMNRDNPDPERYRAVFQLVEKGDLAWEVSYGHLDKIYVRPGQFVAAGTIIGTVGNTGTVYSAGRYVTKEERLGGSKAGAHLHGPQVRPCRKVRFTVADKQYLADGNGILVRDGKYFEVIDYDNGFNGCVDPYPRFNGAMAKNAATIRSIREQIALIRAALSAYIARLRSA